MPPFENSLNNNNVGNEGKPNLSRRNFLVGAASVFGAAAVTTPAYFSGRESEKQIDAMEHLVQISGFGETELSWMKVASGEYQRDHELQKILSAFDEQDMSTLSSWSNGTLDVTSNELTILLAKYNHPAFKDFVLKDCVISGSEGVHTIVSSALSRLNEKISKYDEILGKYTKRFSELQTEGKLEEANLLRAFVQGAPAR